MRKLSLYVFYSGGASGAKYLKDYDLNYGNTYEIVGSFTDSFAAWSKHPIITGNDTVCDYAEWCEGSECAKKDMKMRAQYFYECVLPKLKEVGIDLILLSGFMLKIPPNLIAEYENMIINVHPANLSVTKDGKPIYVGDNAVKVAMDHGNNYTRSTVHFVTDEVDCGKIITISEPLSVEGGITPKEQQEKMKDMCDGPAIMEALNKITSGQVKIGTKNHYA